MRVRVAAFFLALVLAASAGVAGEIAWQGWSDAAFVKAKAEKRLVLLDLGAVWCHWCHVMEETTYKDPKVVALLGEHFVAVRVDQDARPDLSNRYEDYGWPATIIFDASGRELVKFAGYIAPERMISLLEGVVADPTPGPSAAPEVPMGAGGGGTLPGELRQELAQTLVARYDKEQGGWGFSKKYLDWESVEWSLVRSRAGDEDAKLRAQRTLELSRKLIDPVWGGLYQYSDSGDWDHPHFEKLMQFQAEGIRIYAQAYALWRDPADLAAARDILRYVRAFLTSPEGAFYVSQDADLVSGEHSGEYYALSDGQRRSRGVPRVDTHLYARETAWGACALVALYGVTGEGALLEEALKAARWILANRQLSGGGFRHGGADAAGPYLGDTLAAGRAFLALYAATGDRAWLARAGAAARFIGKTFAAPGMPGFVTAVSKSRFAPARPQRDENVALARFANLLFRYTGKAASRELAKKAMTFLAVPEVARRFSTASVLLADAELSAEPSHVTVVGARSDPRTRDLLLAALSDPSGYKRVEAWDPADGPLINADVEFPQLDRPAAFACANGRCSLPAFEPGQLRDRVERLRAAAGK
ncbi:MAG: thioredoxin domain-containing protein [Thermoanaerobaculia bacterium]